MNIRKAKQIISIIASIGVVSGFVVEQVKNTKTHRRKMAEIQFKKEQDLMAIGRASGMVQERLDNGKYRTITEAMNDFDHEIEFQKIIKRF